MRNYKQSIVMPPGTKEYAEKFAASMREKFPENEYFLKKKGSSYQVIRREPL